MEHLNLEKILSYIENQIIGKDIDEIEAHLATCERCHGIYTGLMSVGEYLQHSFETEKATTSCPDDWEIGALVREELLPEMSEKISGHIKDCSVCIDRTAMYYKAFELKERELETPRLWKEKAVQFLKSESKVKERQVSIFQQIFAFFQRISAPLPSLPGYAAAVLVILVVIIWNVIPQKEKIITIASSERIITRDSEIPSAFGFTGAGESREVENMEVFYAGRDIVFKWKPIEGAVKYEFFLKDKAEGKTVYSGHTDKDARVSLKKDLMEGNRLYSWLITGKTTDDKYFEYTGDFLLLGTK